MKRWIAGAVHWTGRLRFLPLYVSPVFGARPRVPVGVVVGIFGRCVFVGRFDL